MPDININDWDIITEEDFNEMQFDSGFIMKDFDPTTFVKPSEGDMACITTGDYNITYTPNIIDLGEDVNNIHGKYAELQYLASWDTATLGVTALGFSKEIFKLVLGAADVQGDNIKPRLYLKNSDFNNIAWVGLKIGGGFAAVVLNKSISTGGLNITTTKNGKGKHTITISGFRTIKDKSKAEMEFYSRGNVYVSLDKSSDEVAIGDTITITATTVPASQTITWTSSDTDKATVVDGAVTGVAVGTVNITATMNVEGIDYTATCKVTVTSGV